MPQLSILTVTYNSQSTIKEFLISIDKYLKDIDHEIIIVDNDSSDDTLESIKSTKIKVKLLPQSENLGFSKSNNIAARSADSDLLLFLNPDTRIIDDSLTEAIAYLKVHTDTGILAPKLIQDDASTQPSIQNKPTIVAALKEFWLNQKGSFMPYTIKSDSPVEVQTVVGAAMLIKKEIFEKVKGFSEKFFLYFEDIDLCDKVKASGYKIIYFPKTTIKHKVGISAKTNPKSSALLIESAKIYHGTLNYFIIYTIIRLRQIFDKLT